MTVTMSMCCSRIPNVYPSLSLPHFIKHLATSSNATLWSTRKTNISIRTNTSSTHHNHPLLETLTHRQKEQISLYIDTLLQWNQKMNLTAVTETNEIMTRHVEDSLAIIPPIHNNYTSCGDSISLVDVGSGAGLPGLIFAIACPGWRVTLLESMNKRCLFLEHAISVTGLSNVQVLRGRAEDVGQNEDFREVFDVAVARAVAEMRILAEYCLPLVRVGGLFIAAKGHDPQEEVRNADKAIKLLGGSVLQLCPVESHSPYGQRTAIVCLKDRPTPRRYPREPGTPAKVPL